jgi:hypothetical protein
MKSLSLSRFALAASFFAMAGCGGGNSVGSVPQAPQMPVTYDTLPYHKTFNYTGTRQSFIVPHGVKRITIVARGGMGGGPASTGGGRSGRVFAIIPVTSGEQLYVFVGGAAKGQAGGFNGGGNGGSRGDCGDCTGYGGGGASDVRRGGYKMGDRILVAGGGGGNGANGDEYYDVGGSGGKGGGSTAGAGHSGSGDGTPGGGGGGGTQYDGGKGGAGGTGSGSGISGSLGVGGDGGSGASSYGGSGGGGAGGGYYGGGGGGAGSGSYTSSDEYESGGGGGGGSSWIKPGFIEFRGWQGWKSKEPTGLVVFSWK